MTTPVIEGAADGVLPKLPDPNKPTAEQLAETHSHKAAVAKQAIEQKAKEEAAIAAAEAAKKAAEDPAALAAAEAKAKADKEAAEAANADWAKDYVQIDHPDAQAAIDMLKDAKVTPIEANAIFEEAMKTGDQSKINWALLEAKIGPAKTRLVKNGVDAYYNDHVKTVMATKTAVFEIVGSEDNWNKITAWAKGLEKTDATFAAKLGPMRQALEIGGWAAEQVATTLKQQFEADPKNKGLGVAKVLVGGKSVPVTGNPITNRTDYMAQLKEAQAKGDQVLVASLRERRRAGMRG